MLSDGALLSLVVARLCGGRFGRLAELRLRWAWAFITGFGLQAVLMTATLNGFDPAIRYSGWVHLISYLFLAAGIGANRASRPLQVVGLGLLMNFVVIAANGGHMPVDVAALRRSGRPDLARMLVSRRSGKHVVMTARTRLAFLGDRYLLPRPYPRPCVFSPGDVPITLGACALVLVGMGAFGLRHRPPDPEPAQEAACPAAK